MGHHNTPTPTEPNTPIIDPSKRLLTLQQVSAITGVPRRTLQKAVANGTLRAIRFTGSTRGKFWVEQRDVDRMKQLLRRRANEPAGELPSPEV
jgi:excisionase family DNA binding protein